MLLLGAMGRNLMIIILPLLIVTGE